MWFCSSIHSTESIIRWRPTLKPIHHIHINPRTSSQRYKFHNKKKQRLLNTNWLMSRARTLIGLNIIVLKNCVCLQIQHVGVSRDGLSEWNWIKLVYNLTRLKNHSYTNIDCLSLSIELVLTFQKSLYDWSINQSQASWIQPHIPHYLLPFANKKLREELTRVKKNALMYSKGLEIEYKNFRFSFWEAK